MLLWKAETYVILHNNDSMNSVISKYLFKKKRRAISNYSASTSTRYVIFGQHTIDKKEADR